MVFFSCTCFWVACYDIQTLIMVVNQTTGAFSLKEQGFEPLYSEVEPSLSKTHYHRCIRKLDNELKLM